jgi:hypothetical protein
LNQSFDALVEFKVMMISIHQQKQSRWDLINTQTNKQRQRKKGKQQGDQSNHKPGKNAAELQSVILCG